MARKTSVADIIRREAPTSSQPSCRDRASAVSRKRRDESHDTFSLSQEDKAETEQGAEMEELQQRLGVIRDPNSVGMQGPNWRIQRSYELCASVLPP